MDRCHDKDADSPAALRKQSRLYRMLIAADGALLGADDDIAMLRKICKSGFAVPEITAAWAGLVDPATGQFDLVACSSLLNSCRPLVRSLVQEPDAHNHSPTMRALRDGKPQFDACASALPLPEIAKPLRSSLSIAGIAALPLRRAGRTVGTLTLYVNEPDYFDAESRRALESIADRISFVLDHLDAHHRLDGREAEFRALVEQSLTGIYMIEAGRFTYVNARLCEILERSRGEILALSPTDVTCEGDRALVAEQIRRRLSGEAEHSRYEFRIVRPSGEIRHVGAHGSVAVVSGRRMIIGVLQDITERVAAEQGVEVQRIRAETALRGSVSAVSRMVELRDPYTAGHERRVGDIARRIGEFLGLPDAQLDGLEVIGGLHDIGKIAIPAEILSKPGRLTVPEFSLIKEHSRRGFEILAGIEFPWPVAQAVLQHHERIDGKGYPDGGKDGKIIVEARIIAVADTVEAMSSHRPYRTGKGIPAALEEIERGAGTSYDADVARACLTLFRDRGYQIPE